MSETEYQFVTYKTIDDGAIARIMLNRPEARNAQNRGMLVVPVMQPRNASMPAWLPCSAPRSCCISGVGGA